MAIFMGAPALRRAIIVATSPLLIAAMIGAIVV
jgi:hypothetical protein